ncbi:MULTISPECIES: hypothetical protein [unclassified Nocardioides]|uniref:hypothetical protein n=1 Tax=unclassified Nocardioides TaxID=2615069 RepID=UPI000056F663|nr:MULTISPECIES: hypothetical protein [unclassified Nocardioides]ABL80769.1 hypothetical protein Noca_1255 [Nocardioides sp. JS614]MBI2244916.1 hypothetical protein [Nocardioides sp.]
MEHISLAITRLHLALALVLGRPRDRDERGDVPGWVMITVMTAGLVVAITAVAQPQLKSMLDSALNQVK